MPLAHDVQSLSVRCHALGLAGGSADQRQAVIVLNYAAAHRSEIEARIRANDGALDEAERIAGERARLLA
jgi:hypothetical protein